MNCKILAPFNMSGKKYEAGMQAEFTAEQVGRLPHLLEVIPQGARETSQGTAGPEAQAEQGLAVPPKDKMLKSSKATKKSIKRKV